MAWKSDNVNGKREREGECYLGSSDEGDVCKGLEGNCCEGRKHTSL
jgi:hypothetical protein